MRPHVEGEAEQQPGQERSAAPERSERGGSGQWEVRQPRQREERAAHGLGAGTGEPVRQERQQDRFANEPFRCPMCPLRSAVARRRGGPSRQPYLRDHAERARGEAKDDHVCEAGIQACEAQGACEHVVSAREQPGPDASGELPLHGGRGRPPELEAHELDDAELLVRVVVEVGAACARRDERRQKPHVPHVPRARLSAHESHERRRSRGQRGRHRSTPQ